MPTPLANDIRRRVRRIKEPGDRTVERSWAAQNHLAVVDAGNGNLRAGEA